MTASYSLAHGEITAVLSGFRDCSFDALLCNPPYGLAFQGKKWDYDVPSVELWAECLRVLKPGSPIIACGGSRTYHRLACGIEDSGAELCDKITWIFARGMPKPATTTDKYIDASFGIKRDAKTAPVRAEAVDWEGYGHALRPSAEDIAVGCKPYDGTIAHNVLTHGVGALDIASCQLSRKTDENPRRINEGCWPANVVFGHAAECDAQCVAWCPVRQLDEQSGERPSNPFPANDAEGTVLPFTGRSAGGVKDTGGASRFFYCPKVSRGEREAGCEHLPLKTAAEVTGRKEGSAGSNRPQAGAGRGSGCRNHHPTLKPLSLTTWLARLICPPSPGVILVPFAGAGSEMIGCLKAGWSGVFGIEREAEYVEIARARLAHWCPESEAA